MERLYRAAGATGPGHRYLLYSDRWGSAPWIVALMLFAVGINGTEIFYRVMQRYHGVEVTKRSLAILWFRVISSLLYLSGVRVRSVYAVRGPNGEDGVLRFVERRVDPPTVQERDWRTEWNAQRGRSPR